MTAEGGSIDAAVERLRSGELVAFPTETVWGLAACARSRTAMERLRAWKGRGDDAPVSVLVGDASGAERSGLRVPPAARRLMNAFWPGPLTLVLPPHPAAEGFAAGIANAEGGVGLRCSSHPGAAALAKAADEAGLGPITATSLNRSGEPPARTRAEAAAACNEPGRGVFLLEGAGDASGEAPSTVVDCTREPPRVLREGAIATAALEAVLEQPLQKPTQAATENG